MNDGVCDSTPSLQPRKLSVPPRHILGTQPRTILNPPHVAVVMRGCKGLLPSDNGSIQHPCAGSTATLVGMRCLACTCPGEPHGMAHAASEKALGRPQPGRTREGAGAPPVPGTAAGAVCRTLRVPHACVPLPPGE